jgi:hypothetical protein
VQGQHAVGAELPDPLRSGVAGDDCLDIVHETRIARARVREVVTTFALGAAQADIAKSTVVRRINDQIKALVRSAEIEPDSALVAELIVWIVDVYPDDFALERTGRPTPARGRDVIPLHLIGREMAG